MAATTRAGQETTTIERFQKLQIELVRSGFATEFLARPNGGDNATLTMFVDLEGHKAENVEYLDRLAAGHGFSYTVQDSSRAAFRLAGDDKR